jgi:hypothetical protein
MFLKKVLPRIQKSLNLYISRDLTNGQPAAEISWPKYVDCYLFKCCILHEFLKKLRPQHGNCVIKSILKITSYINTNIHLLTLTII